MAKAQQAPTDQGKENVLIAAFNRGLMSPLGLARTDFKRTALSSTININWMPRLLGSHMVRPGTFCIDQSYQNVQPINIPFIFSNTDTAIIEMTPNNMCVRVEEQLISRAPVATTITNGTFAGNITGWTQNDDSGATSQYAATNQMQLTGNGNAYARRYQHITVAPGDIGTLHAIRIVVNSADTVSGGDVQFQVGSTLNGTDLVNVANLRTGTYSFAFTPEATDVYVQVQANTIYSCYIGEIIIEPSGVMALPTPYQAADLNNIRWDQSADVIFLACAGYQQMRIERHSTHGWGISTYMPPDGPMMLPYEGTTTFTPGAISGDTTITASEPTFQPGHLGAVFSITSQGQLASSALSAQNTFTNPIEVTGVGSERNFNVNITGTFSGTVSLQYSVGSPGAWVDQGSAWTAPVSTTINDGFDNSTIYYRLGIKTGNYVSGTATCALSFPGGNITGIFRVTNVNSNTSVNIRVLTALGGTAATNVWSEGQWSSYRGFPTSVDIFEGRLWWAGQNNISGSVSDAYESYNIATTGNSGPIIQGIGSGPLDTINWLLGLLRLEIGGEAAVHSCRSSAIDTPLTPTDFSIKAPVTIGSSNVPPLKFDIGGFFVSSSGTRLYELNIQNVYYSYDYEAKDRSIYCPEATNVGISRIAIQRYPDTRIHCVLTDGTVAVLVYDRNEDVQAWVKIVMYNDSEDLQDWDQVVDVIVMPNPGVDEDLVYYVVARQYANETSYQLERWALESECIGGNVNKNLDSHILYSGSPTSTLPLTITTSNGTIELFSGREVGVWADGKSLGNFFINDGQTTLDISNVIPGQTTTVSNAVIGYPFPAAWQSTKLAYAVPGGTALSQKKKLDHLSVIAQNIHQQSLFYGNMNDMAQVLNGTISIDDVIAGNSNMQGLPQMVNDQPVDLDTVWADYDFDMFEFPGERDTDARIALFSPGGLPCTLLAAVIGIEGVATQ